MPLAKKYYKVVSTLAAAALLIISLGCFFGRVGITTLFTNEPRVHALTVKVMPILSLQYLFDGLQGYCQGPIRALGLQRKAAFIAVGCYYILSVPLAAIFGFVFDWSC